MTLRFWNISNKLNLNCSIWFKRILTVIVDVLISRPRNTLQFVGPRVLSSATRNVAPKVGNWHGLKMLTYGSVAKMHLVWHMYELVRVQNSNISSKQHPTILENNYLLLMQFIIWTGLWFIIDVTCPSLLY